VASTDSRSDETPPERPLLVDLLRAYEGLLLGVIVVIVALAASAGVLGPSEFVALLVVPPILMVFVMRRGAPRDLFRWRATGAVLGWVAVWALFLPLYLVVYVWAFPRLGEYGGFTLLAILDGIVLGVVLAAVDRLGARWRVRKRAHAG